MKGKRMKGQGEDDAIQTILIAIIVGIAAVILVVGIAMKAFGWI